MNISRLLNSLVFVATNEALHPLKEILQFKFSPITCEHREKNDAQLLNEIWKLRLDQLNEAGFFHGDHMEGLYMRAMKCLPSNAELHENERAEYQPCNFSSICPFCWCRHHVENTFFKFNEILHKYNINKYPFSLESTLPLNIIQVDSKLHYPFRINPKINDIYNWINTDGLSFYREHMQYSLGGYIHHSIVPSDSDSRNRCGWLLRQRITVLAHNDIQGDIRYFPRDPNCDQLEQKTNTVCKPTPRELAEAIGRSFRYPHELVAHQPKFIIERMNARKRFGAYDECEIQGTQPNGTLNLSTTTGVLCKIPNSNVSQHERVKRMIEEYDLEKNLSTN